MQHRSTYRHIRGVTLIELLVVIAVVAILGTIAANSYRQYGLRANRTDGTAVLLKLQAAEEKYFLQNNTYTANLGTDGAGIANGTGTTSMTTPGGFYTISVAPTSAGCTLQTCYTATATAIAGQVKDTACPSFTIDDQGQHGPVSTAAVCWK